MATEPLPVPLAPRASPRPLSLRRSFSWTLAANVIFAICQWGMLVVLAKVGSPALVGEFALGLAVTAPIVLLAGMSLRTVQATDAQHLFRFGDYLGLRLVTTALALLVIAAIIAIVGYSGTVALTILLVGIGKGLGALLDVYHGLFQRRRLMNLVARSIILNGVLSLVGLAVAFIVTRSVVWAAGGLAFGSALTLVLYDVPVGHRLLRSLASEDRAQSLPARRPPLGAWARLVWLALPLGVSAGLISLAVNVPRYAVEAFLGEASLGIFVALAYFMVAGNTVVSALAESALPVLADRYAARDRIGFWNLLRRLLGIGGLLAALGLVGAALIGPMLVAALYAPEYARHQDVLLWLVAATGFGFIGWFLGAAISAARRFPVEIVINGGLMVTMLIGSVVVIPTQGLVGAAWVVAAAMAVQTVLRAVVIGRILQMMDGRRLGD